VSGPRRQITARTALCGIVLHPAGRTRSPAMHNAAFAELGIDAVYTAFDVRPDDLAAALAGARALGIRQLAVSLPHQQAVIAHLDAVDARARRIGTVDTITLRDGALIGSNTSWIGAVRALEREGSLAGAHAVVLGAGGAARAVVYGLLDRGARVSVLSRSVDRARALVDDLGGESAGALSDLAELPYDVLVNTTSPDPGKGGSPVDASQLRPAAVVMDAVDDPEQTRRLRGARILGARVVPGKWMLVHQAAEQLREWTGREAPIEVMSRAFDVAATG